MSGINVGEGVPVAGDGGVTAAAARMLAEAGARISSRNAAMVCGLSCSTTRMPASIAKARSEETRVRSAANSGAIGSGIRWMGLVLLVSLRSRADSLPPGNAAPPPAWLEQPRLRIWS